MKKANLLVLGLIMAMGLSSCIKEGDTFDWRAQYELEKPIIEEYAETHLSNPTLHEETGIWYEIVSTGEPESFDYKAEIRSGQYYPEAPEVTVTYTGKLMNGTTVLSKDEAELSFGKSGDIPAQAWIAMFFPKEILYDLDGELLDEPFEFGGITATGLKKGAIVRFITPSYMANGNQSVGNIPANSPLDFEIEVIDIASPSGSGN